MAQFSLFLKNPVDKSWQIQRQKILITTYGGTEPAALPETGWFLSLLFSKENISAQSKQFKIREFLMMVEILSGG